MATHSTNPGSLAAVARACCYGGAALANRPGVGSYHHDNLLPRLVSQDDCGWSRIAIWIHNSQNSGSRSQHNNKQEAVQRHCRWDVPSNQKFGELYPLWRMEHMTPGERGETERKKEKRHKETRQERWRHFTPSAASEIPSNFFWSVSNIFALFIFVPHLWNKISSSGKEENACREDKERGRTREFMRASGRERNKTGVCFRNVCSCYTFGVRSSLKRTFIEKRKREARARRERERERERERAEEERGILCNIAPWSHFNVLEQDWGLGKLKIYRPGCLALMAECNSNCSQVQENCPISQSNLCSKLQKEIDQLCCCPFKRPLSHRPTHTRHLLCHQTSNKSPANNSCKNGYPWLQNCVCWTQIVCFSFLSSKGKTAA